MKKRLLSLILALVMAVGMLPLTTAFAYSDTDQIVTVEKYDAEGNGTFLLGPTRVTKIGSGYGNAWVSKVLGSNVKMSNDAVVGYVDATQEDGWLDNGDLAGSSKWLVSVNGVCYEDTSWFYAKEVNVGRIIFSPSGTGSEFNLSDAGWADVGTLTVSKDSLIEYVSRYSAEDFGEGSAADSAYQAALDMILNLDATQEEVDGTLAALKAAMNPAATGITLSPETVTVNIGKTQTVTAALTPAGATDTVTWSIADTAVAAVDENGTVTGVAEGTTTLTARVNDTVSQTIPVTVSRVAATGVTLQETAEVPQGKSVQLTATVLPEDATDKPEWSVADSTIASVDETGFVTGLTMGATTVIATVNGYSAECALTVTESTDPYVYFQYSDGTKKLAESDGSFTLGALDVGQFVVANAPGTASWSCNDQISAGGDELKFHYWVNSTTGAWLPSGTQPTKNVEVWAGGFYQSFPINYQVTSGITELKNYIGDTEVTTENPYTTEGTVSGVYVTTKGLKDGEWIIVPQQALKYTTSDTSVNIRWIGSTMYVGRSGTATMTTTMLGESVSSSFNVVCTYVPVESMEVIVPETAYIHDWNVYNGYVGLLPNTGFQVNFEPSNATNRDFIFEDLTPDVATYMVEHNNGIVPKKPGIAKFKVYSADNQNIWQEITINFEYKNKLTAATTEASYTMKVGDKQNLTINTTPSDASEQRFNWSYSQNGIVNVESSIATDIGGTSHWTTHSMVAWAPGTVTVTGTPVDQTGGCQPVQFTVTVTGSGAEAVDHLALAKNDITHGLEYLANQSMDEFGDEWTIFTTLRAGGTVSQADQTAYCASVKAKLDSGTGLATNDYVRLVLTLGAMGKDPTNFEGYDLVAWLYNNASLGSQASNMVCWTLTALDSKNYEVPQNALWTRQKLIDSILEFQVQSGENTGAFDLSKGGTTGSVDMTGMVLQSLAPYNTAEYPAVQAAFEKALTYLKGKLTVNAGYVEGGTENSCTAAQVVTALCAAGIDPLNSANGFTQGTSNLISNLHTFRVEEGGFTTYAGRSADLMGTQQTTYALVAYERFAENRNRLYDLTDVAVYVDPRAELSGLLAEAEALNEADYTASSWSVLKTAVTAAEEVLANEQATDEELMITCETLSKAIAGLVRESSGPVIPGSNQISVTFRLVGAERATQDVDMTISDYAPKYVTWIKTTSYTVDEGSTVDDVFRRALAEAGMTCERGAGGNYIKSITAPRSLGGYSLGEFDNGAYTGWMYTVNGVHVSYGLQEQELEDGDEIVWHYVNDYRYEIEDWYGGSPFGSPDTFNKWLDAEDVNPSSSGSVAGGSVENNADQKAADTVADLIADIGTVTKDSGSKIQTAREAYDALTDAQKALVSNYEVLTEAEAAFAKLSSSLPFTDVKETDYFCDAVKWAVEKEITNGTTDSTFSPDASCTRAQMVTFLWRAAGSPEPSGSTTSFTDVDETAYYYKALLWAIENGITNGTSDTTFSPDATCTRSQAVAFLYRNAKSPALDSKNPFTDVKESDYFYAAVLWAVEEGITVGTGDTAFSPDATCTRGQMVTFLYRYFAL